MPTNPTPVPTIAPPLTAEAEQLFRELLLSRQDYQWKADDIASLLRSLDEARKDSELFKWMVKNVKMIYWPKDGSYPVEHNPAAWKDGMMFLREAHHAAMSKKGSQ